MVEGREEVTMAFPLRIRMEEGRKEKVILERINRIAENDKMILLVAGRKRRFPTWMNFWMM